MAEHDTYIVRESDSGWVVSHRGVPLATVEDRTEAVEAAIAAAQASARAGIPAEVLSQDQDGTAHPIWASKQRSLRGQT